MCIENVLRLGKKAQFTFSAAFNIQTLPPSPPLYAFKHAFSLPLQPLLPPPSSFFYFLFCRTTLKSNKFHRICAK